MDFAFLVWVSGLGVVFSTLSTQGWLCMLCLFQILEWICPKGKLDSWTNSLPSHVELSPRSLAAVTRNRVSSSWLFSCPYSPHGPASLNFSKILFLRCHVIRFNPPRSLKKSPFHSISMMSAMAITLKKKKNLCHKLYYINITQK